MKAQWADQTNYLQKFDGFTIFSAIPCPLNEMPLCLEIRAYFHLTQLCTWGILKKSWKTDRLKGVTQPPLSTHFAPSYVTTFDKGKRKLSYLHFSIWRLRITELTTLKMKTLTWWMSSVKITANLSAEDRELQDSSTGQQLRRLLMYWFVGLWNADNLCHTFISFLWLSLVPSAPGPPQQNNLSLLLSQVSINALCSRCHGATQTHQGY